MCSMCACVHVGMHVGVHVVGCVHIGHAGMFIDNARSAERIVPKSPSLIILERVRKMFWVFKSRCRMLCWCRYCRPNAICIVHSTTRVSGSSEPRWLRSFVCRSPPSQYPMPLTCNHEANQIKGAARVKVQAGGKLECTASLQSPIKCVPPLSLAPSSSISIHHFLS